MPEAIKSVTVKQIQQLDEAAINQYGVPSLALMENAGKSVAMEVIKMVRSVRRPVVTVVCGLGNNAGDGFVIARHLINHHVKTNIILVGSATKLKHDALVNYSILKKLKYPIKEMNKMTSLIESRISEADVVVDAIFGVGLNREVLDPFRGMILAMNQLAGRIVAVDTPSGLDATTGRLYGVGIKAKKTVTFSFAKKGFFLKDGPKHTGKVMVVDIGIPDKLKKRLTR